MTQFLAAFEDLFKSIYELIASLIGTILNVFQGIISAVLAIFTGIFNLVTDTIGAGVKVVGGLGQFVVGNIVILSIVAVGGYLYVQNQQKRGKPIVPIKKTQ